ncbi:MAG: NAD(P)/FAD-dependent oxidoreductase, partial [Candidatus Nucleicultricaceae bacterium]
MTYDVAIIGNGILGLSTAFSLFRLDPTLKIAIVAPTHREGSASVAAGAMLNAYAELTSTSLKSKAGQEKFENALKASKKWDSWIQSINDFLPESEKLTIQDGTFVILNAKSGILDSENFNAILNTLKQHQETYEEVDPQSIPGLNPVEDCRPLRSLYLPNEGCINSGRVINALEGILQKHCNVTFINQKALSFNVTNHAVVSLATDQGDTISARHFVIAAGSYSQKLIDTLPQISRNIPRLLSGMGCSLVVSQDPKHNVRHVIRTPNRSGACGLHVTPQGQDLYIGATNNVYEEPRSNHKIGFTHFLLECALEQINQNLHSADL